MKKTCCVWTAALLCLVLLSLAVPAAAASASVSLRWERGSGSSATLSIEGLDGTRNVYAAQLDITLDGVYQTAQVSQTAGIYSTQTIQASGGVTKLSLYWCAEGDTPLGTGREVRLGTLTLDHSVSAPARATLTLLDWSLAPFIEGEVTVREVTPGGSGGYVPSPPGKEPDKNDPLPFTDVAAGDWFYSAVQYAYQRGIVSGTSATTFSPNDTVTRAMIVALLHRLEGEPDAAASGFSDVGPAQWYTHAVGWAAANSIVMGYSNGTFGPGDTLTREQMAAILYRYAGTKGMDLSADTDLSAFSDHAAVSGYALDAMKWAVDRGLIQGTGNGMLSPQGSATRAQAAAVLMRFCEKLSPDGG